MTNIKEQIRAEIERQKEYSRSMRNKAISNRMKYYFDGADEMCNQLLNFIDSQPDEKPEVELEKVVMIDNVIMNMTAEGYNNGYKTRPFYEEVLRRFNARKDE